MNTLEEQVVKGVLGRMADEAPEPVGFDELGVLELQHVGSAPPAVRIQRPASVMTLAAIATIVLVGIGGLVFATGSGSPAASGTSNVLIVPSHTPEGLTLSQASMWTSGGSPTRDPAEAVTTGLVYLPPGEKTWDEGDWVLTIDVDDRFAVLQRDELICYEDVEGQVRIDSETCRRQFEESECSGLAPLREGQLDPTACIREAIEGLQRLQEDPPQGLGYLGDHEVTFTELTVRDKPALLAEIQDHSVSVTTFEGGGVVSTVTGQQIDRDVVLQVAKGLQPATADGYAIFTTTAQD